MKADVGIKGDRIAAVENLKNATAATIVEAKGLAVARGLSICFRTLRRRGSLITAR